ncbi:MAG: GAF domain-containing protein [Anaerolineae bacterium]|jgi:GAF domain-containing protein|nr:GAF domain-containing protein [Anaerolineae bacterium]
MPDAASRIIQNAHRLQVLRNLSLLDSPAESSFDRLTQLASKILKVPVSLVSLVDTDRQFFKSFCGLPQPWSDERETPLSHSFCQHVVASGQILVIEDARTHPLVYDNLAIRDLGVIAYLGVPLHTSNGVQLGSFCVIDSKPYQWTPEDIEIVEDIAKSVMTEIELRSEILARCEIEQKLRESSALLDDKNRHLQRITEFTLSTIEHTIEAMQRQADDSEIIMYLTTAKQALTKKHRLDAINSH